MVKRHLQHISPLWINLLLKEFPNRSIVGGNYGCNKGTIVSNSPCLFKKKKKKEQKILANYTVFFYIDLHMSVKRCAFFPFSQENLKTKVMKGGSRGRMMNQCKHTNSYCQSGKNRAKKEEENIAERCTKDHRINRFVKKELMKSL